MGKAESVYKELKRRLQQGVYVSGSRFPSEVALADEFGVNKMTINKTVSLLVKEGFLIRGIRGAGTKVAEAAAMRLRGSIAFFGNLSPYCVRILDGVLRECKRNNFSVMIEKLDYRDFPERISFLSSNGVSGIISVGGGKVVLPPDMHHVCVDRAAPENTGSDIYTHYVNSDNYHGGVLMMEEILRRGHRDIAIFSSESSPYSPNAETAPRLRGFCDVLRRIGMPRLDERQFFAAPGSLADAVLFLQEIRKKFPGLTLIAADSDGSADLLHKAARSLHISCPGKELALTGFGAVSLLPIASVNQNPERQGELAARNLIKIISEEAPETALNLEIEADLVGTDYIPILTV